MMLCELIDFCRRRCSHIKQNMLIILYVLLMNGVNTYGFCLIGNPSWTGAPNVSPLEYERNASNPHQRGNSICHPKTPVFTDSIE